MRSKSRTFDDHIFDILGVLSQQPAIITHISYSVRQGGGGFITCMKYLKMHKMISVSDTDMKSKTYSITPKGREYYERLKYVRAMLIREPLNSREQ